jgi:Rrf2 family protein
MKISKQDEYGLRVLLRIAKADKEEGLSIPQLSELEGLSQPYAAKITRELRLGKLIESTPGQRGGYVLAKPAAQITIKEAIDALGGQLFHKDFCGSHSAQQKWCTNSVDCSVRSLWRALQQAVDVVLDNITLEHLTGSENQTNQTLEQQLHELLPLVMSGTNSND